MVSSIKLALFLFICLIVLSSMIIISTPSVSMAEKRIQYLENCKQYLKFKSPEFKQTTYLVLNDPFQGHPLYRAHFRLAQEKIDGLIKGERLSNSTPHGVQTFDQFCSIIPEWCDSNKSYVFFRDHPKVKDLNVLVQRIVSGSNELSSVQAPIVVQHYVVSLAAGINAGMIDSAKMFCENWDEQRFELCLFEHELGYDSRILLDDILHSHLYTFHTSCTYFEDNLKKFGPILVSNFKVHSDFLNKAVHKHHGIPLGDSIGLHSMVLIGTRKDEQGKLLYLLQNWWKSKQFIEVDCEYLKGKYDPFEPTVFKSVKKFQLSIPNKFSINFARFVEIENFDKPDASWFLDRIDLFSVEKYFERVVGWPKN